MIRSLGGFPNQCLQDFQVPVDSVFSAMEVLLVGHPNPANLPLRKEAVALTRSCNLHWLTMSV